MRIALAQINPTVGDLEANADLILARARQADEHGADLTVFPELAISGYPPRDLVETAGYVESNEAQLHRIAAESSGLRTALAVGYCGAAEAGDGAANCVAGIHGGRVAVRHSKILLPTYDVFDESRHFKPGSRPGVWNLDKTKIGLTVCEDAWNDKQFWERSRYSRDPVEELAAEGVDLLVNLSASPYHIGKRPFRLEMFGATARRHGLPAVLVNQVGGNDQLLFDGSSFAIGRDGQVRARAASFEEDLVFWTLGGESSLHGTDWTSDDDEGEDAAVFDALVMGTRDYVRKCGFERAIVGLSGGIDSSLTVVVAVEALGAENVTGVAMPGPYSSEGSVTDARQTAETLGIRFETVCITEAHDGLLKRLQPLFAGRAPDVTEENMQARLRGDILMALSNKFNALVLTTGNKSEMAVGYCTLYGDMCGGLAVISDVPKTLAYRLATVANRRHPGAIPESVLTKPPSAELRPDQKDSDSLPPYEVLDPILRLYVEEHLSVSAIADRLGEPAELVGEVARLVDRNEYKRQQAAPGLRVTSKAFGMGRRFPIAQKFIR